MIWKNIKGFENLYEVSSSGLIRTIPRRIYRSNGRIHTVRQRVLKPSIDKSGYKRVGLMRDGKLVTKKVHRLVAENFYVFNSGQEVNHVDGDKLNNHYKNLEWTSRSDNMKHAFKLGLAKGLMGEDNPFSKISEYQALTIKTLLKSKWKLIDISKSMNISYSIVKDINRNKTWKHISV